MKSNSIYTKKEIAELFKLKHQSRVSTLLSQGKLVQNGDGKIDLSHPTNSAYIELRKITVPLYTNGVKSADEVQVNNSDETEGKNGLDLQIQEEKLKSIQLANTSLEIKQKKQLQEIIEISVLRSVIGSIFDNFFKNLIDYPSLISEKLTNIYQTSENPQGEIVEFLTKGIREQISAALEQTEKKLIEAYE